MITCYRCDCPVASLRQVRQCGRSCEQFPLHSHSGSYSHIYSVSLSYLQPSPNRDKFRFFTHSCAHTHQLHTYYTLDIFPHVIPFIQTYLAPISLFSVRVHCFPEAESDLTSMTFTTIADTHKCAKPILLIFQEEHTLVSYTL